MSSTFSPRHLNGAAVLLGLALRTFHYLRQPSVWHDEAALILNIIDKDFVALLGPLDCDLGAPPLFLWLERAVYLLLGDGLLALRLIPFLASCLALLLFAALTRRLLTPLAAVWAVLLFATSDQLLWHACEAKHYSTDVLVAVGCLVLHFGPRTWPLTRQLLLAAALLPVLIWLSYPGAFLCGALWLARLPAVLRQAGWGPWGAQACAAACMAGAFLLLVLGPAAAQRTEAMCSCWTSHFPDWSRPWGVPVWVLYSTLDVARYNLEPVGQTLAGVALVGILVLLRDGRRAWLVLLTGPSALALVAALLRRYPYGGSRMEVFAAPALALLIGVGLPAACYWLRRCHRAGEWALLLLLATVPACTFYHVVRPWQRADCGGAAELVLNQRRPGELVAANHYEFRYYFRRLGNSFHCLGPNHPRLPNAPRVWLLYTAGAPGQVPTPGKGLLAGWRLLRRRDLERTTVLLLERPNISPR